MLENYFTSSQISLLEYLKQRAEGRKIQVDNEEPFIPFYKPYGMSDEEYTYEIQSREQERGKWQSSCEYNQCLDEDITYLTEQINKLK